MRGSAMFCKTYVVKAVLPTQDHGCIIYGQMFFYMSTLQTTEVEGWEVIRELTRLYQTT